MTNPLIYTENTGTVFPWTAWMELACSDVAALYGLAAQGAIHLLLLRNKALNLDIPGNRSELGPNNEANFYLFKAMELLHKKFEDTKEALSNTTIFIVALLTASVVSIPLHLLPLIILACPLLVYFQSV
jgi:hypothetical protein